MSHSPTGSALGATLRVARATDRRAVIDLLVGAGLPTEGIPSDLDGFVVAERLDGLVGVAALERYGRTGLLRSVAVSPTARSRGIAGVLVQRIIADAAASDIDHVYLLTTTAETYFPRHGFRPISRADVPAAVQASVEFRGACPSTAVVMHRQLR